MKAQLSITVRGDLLMKYTSLPIWFLSKKPYIGLFIDQKPQKRSKDCIKLKLKKEPYIVEIEPGEHELYFTDSNSGNRRLISTTIKATIGIAFDCFFAGATGEFDGTGLSSAMNTIGKYEIQDNYIHLNLNEGELFKISVKPGKKGKIKIEVLN